jgi:hypothetical protein
VTGNETPKFAGVSQPVTEIRRGAKSDVTFARRAGITTDGARRTIDDSESGRRLPPEEDLMNLTHAIRIGLIALAVCVPGFAQAQNNTEKQLTCQNGSQDGQRARHCEIREQAVAYAGRMAVTSDNGSVTIKGWQQSGALVRARIDTASENEGAAALLATKVWVDTSGGNIRANGPENSDGSWWSVSYEIFVPQAGDLELKSTNGAVNVSDVRGQIHFDVVNGAVRMKRVAGEVTGATVNGAIQVELAGNAWEGRQMDLKTQNGSVGLTMPATYSAHIQAETNMGGIQSDFPVATMAEERSTRPRRLEFNIGSGGPLIKVSTGNGSIRFKRAETQ